MIDISIILPDGTRDKGRVDASASIDYIKADIVEAFGLGDPADFEIGIFPRSGGRHLQSFRLTQGDTILVQPKGRSRGKAFVRG